MSRDLKAARAEVAALAAELVSLEALAEKHAAVAGDAARKHRQGAVTAAELQAAVSARAAIDYARDEIRRELDDARAKVAEMESAAADEKLLAEIAAGTVEYRTAEREHVDLLRHAEQVLADAIARSLEFTRAASAAKTRASDAAVRLAQKHGSDRDQMFERAVNGVDVAPLTGNANVTKWPHGRRQVFKLVSQVKPQTMGVAVEAEPVGA